MSIARRERIADLEIPSDGKMQSGADEEFHGSGDESAGEKEELEMTATERRNADWYLEYADGSTVERRERIEGLLKERDTATERAEGAERKLAELEFAFDGVELSGARKLREQITTLTERYEEAKVSHQIQVTITVEQAHEIDALLEQRRLSEGALNRSLDREQQLHGRVATLTQERDGLLIARDEGIHYLERLTGILARIAARLDITPDSDIPLLLDVRLRRYENDSLVESAAKLRTRKMELMAEVERLTRELEAERAARSSDHALFAKHEAKLEAERAGAAAMREALSQVTLTTMGGTPDLFGPDEGWERWDAKVQLLLKTHTAGAEILERLKEGREAAAWAYQLSGALELPVYVLDNMSAIAQGETPPHDWPYPADCERLRKAEATDSERQDACYASGFNDCKETIWAVLEKRGVSGEPEVEVAHVVDHLLDIGKERITTLEVALEKSGLETSQALGDKHLWIDRAMKAGWNQGWQQRAQELEAALEEARKALEPFANYERVLALLAVEDKKLSPTNEWRAIDPILGAKGQIVIRGHFIAAHTAHERIGRLMPEGKSNA